MRNPTGIPRPIIRSPRLSDHVEVIPTARKAVVAPFQRRPVRRVSRVWLVGVSAVLFLGVFAWADTPDAQGRLPDPAANNGAPIGVGNPVRPPLPRVVAPTPALPTEPPRVKVEGIKENPYVSPAPLQVKRPAKRRPAKTPGDMRIRKVDDPRPNPYY